MTEIDPIVPSNLEKGNTKLSQDSPCKRWCFTLNNYSENDKILLTEKFNSSKDLYIIGEEIGESGTPHLQGYVNFSNKIRLTALKKINPKIHWEKCKGSEEDNIKYCSKDNKYVTNFKIKKPLKIIERSKLYKWQEEIVQIVEAEPDDRKIYWYWESTGKVGKTTLCKYLCFHHNAIIIEGKKNDILFCAAQYDSELYIMDFERSIEDYISYGAMEKIKNGLYMCSKYESKPILRNPPHLICFANFPPNLDEMSLDRWVVKQI